MTARRPALLALALLTLCVANLSFTSAQEQQQRSERRQRRQAVPGKEAPHPPQVGEEAPDFQLLNLQGETVSLRELTADSPVVLLVLRGWPGYQCPICTRQVGEFLTRADDFTGAGAEVVMIYPGPADLLADHAKEFQGDWKFPANYHFLIDPDYTFTNAWSLRWDAPRETAYPSTFVIGRDNKIKFAMTSTSHGGRASATTVLEALAKLE